LAKKKIKTNKSAAKRFKLTGTGKLKFHKAGKSHLLYKKSAKRKRRLRGTGIVSSSDARRLKRALPNL